MPLFKRCKGHETNKCRHPFWYVFELHGKRYSRSTRTANKQTAGRVEERRRVAIIDGKDNEPKKPITLEEHIKDYLAHTAEKNVTAYKDKAALERLAASVRVGPLQDVSPFHVEKWKIARAADVSKSTVNRELHIVRGCFTRAVEWGRLAVSPLRSVKDFPVDDHRIRTLSDDELKNVLACDDQTVALVCRVTLECLPRLSEVLGIHRTHIGPDWIEFKRKGGKVTRAFVGQDLTRVLLTRAVIDSGYVFGQGAKGEPPTEQTMSNRIVRKLRALGITDASHHTMRHTGVTLMLEHGVNPRVIQLLAGWASLRMLERYGHARDTEVRRAVNENAAHLAAL